MNPLVSRLMVLPLALVSAIAAAEPVKIGAAGVTGEYFATIVPALNSALAKGDSGLTAEPVETAGSQENLSQLEAGSVDFALIQLDVLALNPSDLIEVVELIAPEALMCAARKDGPVRSYYNLTDERSRPLVVSVGPVGSGSAATMEYLLAIDPDLDPEQLALVYEENTMAELDRLAAGTRDMVCVVMLANPKNPVVDKVASSDNLMFVDFVSAYGLESSVSGMNVYESAVVPVSSGLFGFRADKIQTLTTWMALVASKNASPEAVEALRTAAADPELLSADSIAGRAKALYGQFKDRAKDLSSQATVKALELKEKGLEKAVEIGAIAKEKAAVAREKALEYGTIAKDKALELKDKAIEKAAELKEKAGQATGSSQ